MPLEAYTRGKVYWARGRIDYNSIPISDYYRCSTGASSEAGAQSWIAAETDRVVRRHLFGEVKEELTFAAAVLLYSAKPKEASYLIPIVAVLGERPVSSITPNEVRELGRKLYPKAATDTWVRQVITPIKAVINNAHGHGRCAAIRISGYSKQDRIDQDRVRGKESRREKEPFTVEWVQAFVELTLYGNTFDGLRTRDYQKGIFLYDIYRPLGDKGVIAAQGALCGASDETPFFDLCSLGGTDAMRGFPVTEYLDNRLASVQVEYRRVFTGRLGGVVFAGAGSVGGEASDLSVADAHGAAGVGARIRLSRKFPVDFSIDMSWNNQDDRLLYIYVGQRF